MGPGREATSGSLLAGRRGTYEWSGGEFEVMGALSSEPSLSGVGFFLVLPVVWRRRPTELLELAVSFVKSKPLIFLDKEIKDSMFNQKP